MDCSTCINRQTPYKNGWCRTMSKPPKEKRCHMTKEQALGAEYQILNTKDRSSVDEAKEQIKWLKGLEG